MHKRVESPKGFFMKKIQDILYVGFQIQDEHHIIDNKKTESD